MRRMRDLKRNMCDLDPSLLNSEVSDLKQRVEENISPGLQYACTQMSVHVSQTPADSEEVRGSLEEFAGMSLMYWLEALSLMGKVPEAIGMAWLIESWLMANSRLRLHISPSTLNTVPFAHSSSNPSGHLVTPQHPSFVVPGPTAVGKRAKLKRWLGRLGTISPSTVASTGLKEHTVGIFHDLRRFIMEFMHPITTSSIHIYASALALTLQGTELSRQYAHLAKDGVKVIRGCAAQWSATIWTASKHTHIVRCVAVSPDGTTIISGSGDKTLHLWDAKSGAPVGKAMQGHTKSVTCVAVSPDGTTIASGSDDKTLCLWDAKNGVPIGKQVFSGNLCLESKQPSKIARFGGPANHPC
ncbi:POC1 centriolar protein A [Tulasnella sp. JGI-2019a]|nr:POC1 centriolar protein A [Tulasnella sp. JGI-2019a]